MQREVGNGILKGWRKLNDVSVGGELSAYLVRARVFMPGIDVDRVKSEWASDFVRLGDDEAMVVVAIMIYDNLSQKEIRRITGFEQERLQLVYRALCRLPKTEIHGYAAIRRNIDRLMLNLKAKCSLYNDMYNEQRKLQVEYESNFIEVYDDD